MVAGQAQTRRLLIAGSCADPRLDGQANHQNKGGAYQGDPETFIRVAARLLHLIMADGRRRGFKAREGSDGVIALAANSRHPQLAAKADTTKVVKGSEAAVVSRTETGRSTRGQKRTRGRLFRVMGWTPPTASTDQSEVLNNTRTPLEAEGGARSVTVEGAVPGKGVDRRSPDVMTHTPHPRGSAAHLLPQGEKEDSSNDHVSRRQPR